ncbi:MAG TPA: type II secretion system protein GspC [Polyangiaceae bacterium]|nr:type II secretion system protein GspC [Polyangiaceae bacterium]
MDALVKRYFGVIVAVLLAIAAYLQASGASQLVGTALLGGDDGKPTVAPAVAPYQPIKMAPSRRQTSADPILSRNAFDSVTGPLDGRQIVIPDAPQQKLDLSSPLTAPDCDGIEAVIVTESSDPMWSLAAMTGPGAEHPAMKRVGDKLGDKEVAYIGYNPAQASPAVWMVNGSALCQAILFKRGAPPAPAASAAAAPAAAPADTAAADNPGARGAAAIPPDMASKIQKISETEYSIEHSVVDDIMQNQATLMRSARIVPEQQNGETVGIRLFGIRPDTLLGTLGLQNGDRLEEINGFKMGSPEEALQAYARLRTATSLKIQINRRGKSMNLDYAFK